MVSALIVAVAAVIVSIVGAYVLWKRTPTWSLVDQWIAVRYADIDSISTASLAARLDSNAQSSVARDNTLLLDIREAREYALSRIPGAKHVAPSGVIDYAERELANVDRAQVIVVYCAVGLRSADAARELKLLGFTNVRNLRGSIFQWANESRALEGGSRVHPFDSHWGQLLRKELWAPLQSMPTDRK